MEGETGLSRLLSRIASQPVPDSGLETNESQAYRNSAHRASTLVPGSKPPLERLAVTACRACHATNGATTNSAASNGATPHAAAPPKTVAVDFVCEDDVRRALTRNEKIYIHARTIITPAAHDIGDAGEVFAKG